MIDIRLSAVADGGRCNCCVDDKPRVLYVVRLFKDEEDRPGLRVFRLCLEHLEELVVELTKRLE